MRPLMVAQHRQLLFGKEENLSLIQPAELGVYIEIMFVEGLETRVQESREGRVGGLFDNFRAGFTGVAFGARSTEPEDVQGVLWG